VSRFLTALLVLAVIGSAGYLASAEWSGRSDRTSSPRPGGEYHAPLTQDPPTLDPALSTDATSTWCVMQMFDGLVRQQSGSEIAVAPSIATSWTLSADQRTYTFTLREDVRFQSLREWARGPGNRPLPSANGGRVVDAEDFRYSFERVLRRDTASPRTAIFEVIDGARDFMAGKAARVAGIGTPKRNVLTIRLEKPYAPFLATLTMPAACVVPREDVEQLKEEFSKRPVGSGAFCFERYDAGKELSMVANAGYFLGAPHVRRLTFHVIADEEKRFEMFEDGILHHSSVPDPKYHKVTEPESKYAPYFTEVEELGVYYYGMNTQRPPFDKPEVRRAISHAVDREAIRTYIKSKRVNTASSPLPASLRRWTVSGPDMPITFDLVRAGKILDQAGYPLDPNTGLRTAFPRLPLDVPQSEEHLRVARAIQANLADLGIESSVAVRPFKEHLARVRRGESAFFRLGWVADYKDADSFLYYNFHSNNIGKSNHARYSNPRVDELLDAARAPSSLAMRQKLYREAEEIIVRDAAWICLYYFKTAIVRQPHVRGVHLTEFGEQQIRFEEVWFDRPDKP
jgi:oligopeptide transport system substrate-binding protein